MGAVNKFVLIPRPLPVTGPIKLGQSLGVGGGCSRQSLLLDLFDEGPICMATKGNTTER